MAAVTKERWREYGKLGGRPLEWTDSELDKLAERLEAYMADPEHFYIGGFNVQEGITRQMSIDFCLRHKGFKDAFARAQDVQEQRLVSKALDRTHDGNFTRFVLANRNGWRERTEIAGDPQAPLVQLLASVDGRSKAIIEDAQIVQDAISAPAQAQAVTDQSVKPSKRKR